MLVVFLPTSPISTDIGVVEFKVGRREIHPAAHRAQTRRHAGHARKGVAGLAQALSSAGTGMSARVLTPFELSVQDEAAQDRAYSS